MTEIGAMKISLLALYLFAFGLILQATAFPQDPHAGQPATCNNAAGNTNKCECDRAMTCPMPGETVDESKCQVYCRPDACKCVSPCAT